MKRNNETPLQSSVGPDRSIKYVLYGLIGFFFLYNLLAWTAPVAEKFKIYYVSRPIYKVYSLLCHQLPERSVFLFGEELWHVTDDFENYGYYPEDRNFSEVLKEGRKFYGNEDLGYKVAFCSRDAGIYAAMLIFLVVVTWVKYDFLKIPVWLRFAGMIPLALDGGIQFISSMAYYTGVIGDPFYSSNNLRRIVTGLLFGSALVLSLVPYMKKEMNDP